MYGLAAPAPYRQVQLHKWVRSPVVRPAYAMLDFDIRSVPSKLNGQHEPTAKACAEDNEGRSHPREMAAVNAITESPGDEKCAGIANTFPGELKRRRTQETLPYLGRSESMQ
jgi:hypothetical protein